MIEKEKIIDTAKTLFKRYGIRANTMDDIAKKAGISKKTLYQNISDKTELVNAVNNFEYQNIEKALADIKIKSQDGVEELILVNALIINFLKEINPVVINDLKKLYPELYNNTREQFRDLFFNFIIKTIQEGKQEGIFRKDIDEHLITELHTDKIDKMQELSNFWGVSSSALKVIREMITYYLRGLVTSKGELLLDKHLATFDNYIDD
jgi:AcrR family transcriptional regulator